MRSDIKCKIFSVVCSLFLLSFAVLAQNGSVDDMIAFPDVEGWEKGDITTYPTKELGRSIVYKSGVGGTVTFYVYNSGLKKIANGIDDENVKIQIKQAEDDIKKYGKSGHYQNVKFIKSETVTLGGDKGTTKALYSLFTFKIRGTELDSEIYLLGYKNNFIKIRATRRKGEYTTDNKAVFDLLTEIGKIFSK